MSRIRIKSPQWENYSSYIGTVKFTKGVSDGHVSDAEMRIIGAVTTIEVIEEDGSTHAVGPGQTVADLRSMPAPIVPDLKPLGETDTRDVIPVEDIEVKPAKKPKDEIEDTEAELDAITDEGDEEQTAEGGTVKYSRDELEEIADESGINGLREIGDKYDVKSTSIEGMIKKILSAQG